MPNLFKIRYLIADNFQFFLFFFSLEMSRLTDDLSETEYGKASKEILQSVVHDFLRP